MPGTKETTNWISLKSLAPGPDCQHLTSSDKSLFGE